MNKGYKIGFGITYLLMAVTATVFQLPETLLWGTLTIANVWLASQ